MAPKKKQHQKNPKPNNPKSAPKLQISAENERRLRRLLLNTDRPGPEPDKHQPEPDTATRAQKSKRIRTVYDKLSLEGFQPDQIEKALSSLREGATFESALDWLCLNIPGNELPLKFSSGISSSEPEDRSVKIISIARGDYVPPQRPVGRVEDGLPGLEVKIKGRHEELSLDLGKSSQADWIRQYMEQQEEEELEEEEDPSTRAASIAEEYRNARMGALEAKQKKNKKMQKHFSDTIHKLRQEMASLGLSADILEAKFLDECSTSAAEGMPFDYTNDTFESSTADDSQVALVPRESETSILDENSSFKENETSTGSSRNVVSDIGDKDEEPMEMELDNLFSEDSSLELLPPQVLKQRKSKLPQSAYCHSFANVDEIWKKGDAISIPKAVLQKICQKLSWGAPKYNKLLDKGTGYIYSVSILRKATGRGKSRQAGGLVTMQLPDQDETCKSVEDAQNKVAAFALYKMFPDLPLCQMLKEPYASFTVNLQEGELSDVPEDNEDNRRASFVDSLLDSQTRHSVTPSSNTNSVGEGLVEQHGEVNNDDSSKKKGSNTGLHRRILAESIRLREEMEKKMKLPEYMEMMEARAALPIAKLKNRILQMLNENDVIVVCGETGCGKTTQVPQFILDDIIGSGFGGQCNIICTQPRRIAAISVAERVSEERCESSPGSDGSLVGYQVRLDSARNEKTKLLFCTTGILLRKLAGNRGLSGITHVVVDEVHERSILGDFLLIVLKNLLEKQSNQEGQKLKVILMSATVDSSLFSSYFANCPVLSAEGRTHSVSTYFLEDIYEELKYNLPSDSPASGSFMGPRKGKPGSNSVDNRRGKLNLVLSSWGDETILLEEYSNPHFVPDAYESYSDRTRNNLKNLNEDVIDFDLLEDLICFIDENYPPGAILVFLPGVAEIDMVVDKLTVSYRFGGVSSDWIFPLHSSLASGDQRKVFLSPPQNIRKVIVSTDIAETSITIDDVIYVIDAGKHKENRFNPQKKMSSMVEDWISQANAKQRKGRAGRVKPGICFCLYTRHRFEKIMHPFQVPEMLRMPLTELCLQIKSLSLGDIKSILVKAIEPPREDAITSAIDLLYKLGAFEGDEELSPLGYHLAKLPVDVLIGKMMLYGSIFGCLSPVLSIAGFLSYKNPFIYPKDEKQNVERAKLTLLSNNLDATVSNEADQQSDHLLLALAYSKWSKVLKENGVKAAQQFCRSFFLNSSVMYTIRDMRVQFGNLLADIGLVNLPYPVQFGRKRQDQLDSWFADMSQTFNIYAQHASIIKSVLCAGLYPNVAATPEGIIGALSSKAPVSNLSTKDTFWYDGRREVHIHPTSVNHVIKVSRYPFLVFLEKVETSKVFLRDTTIISPYSILLFGGAIAVHHQTGSVIIDNWLRLAAPAQIAVLFKELRTTLHAVLKELIRKPEMATISNNEVVKSIVHLLLEEEKSQCT